MKFIVYLLTLLFVGTAIAQNPTILQGSYISNVFGNSNFVLNPNAQTNTANVTVSNATVSRSTTTPLVATSEFNITTSTSTGYADWSLRSFDQGMKNNNCEARFSYRGFSVGSTTAQILQGANVVAQLTLTASTDPRIASINFPCGDLSAVTKFRLQQATASLTGTNEIGAIYVGLATNMANVAQAEMIGTLRNYGGNCIWTGNGTSAIAADTDCSTYSKEGLDLQPSTRVPAITFTAPKSGNYAISASIYFGAAAQQVVQCQVYQNGVLKHNVSAIYTSAGATSNENRAYTQFNADLTGGTAYTFDLRCTASSIVISRSVEESLYWTVYRFPSSSELVVTPERQNVWGAVEYRNQNQSLFSGSAEPTGYSSFNNATWNQPTLLKGKAAVTTTNSGNDLGFSIPNLPVGNYKLEISGQLYAQPGSTTVNDLTVCTFRILETTTSVTVAEQVIQAGRPTSSTNTANITNSFQGIFNNTSVATRNFRLETNKTIDTNATNLGTCVAASSASGNTDATVISFTITPLDQPSNSALYVQGPVLGSQTGAAIPAGYVGQVLSTVKSTSTNMATGAWTEVTSITLTPGIWQVRGQASWNWESATISQYNIACAIGESTSDVNTNYTAKYSSRSAIQINSAATKIEEWIANMSAFYVRNDGTNTYFADGTTLTSATQTLKLVCYGGTFSAGTPTIRRATIEAIRLN